MYHSFSTALEEVFFQVATIISSTGFGLGDAYTWPMFSQFVLLILMFIGGCAGSTAGGFKLIRVLILTRIVKNQIKSTLYPSRVLSLHTNGSVVDKATQHSIMKYLTVYCFIIVAICGILTLDSDNFLTVVSSALSCLNNMGPILGSSATFSFYSPFSKVVLSFAMIAGRLELFPMLVLFSPATWKKN
jgi:trk system potassium uptake protein TrkH